MKEYTEERTEVFGPVLLKIPIVMGKDNLVKKIEKINRSINFGIRFGFDSWLIHSLAMQSTF